MAAFFYAIRKSSYVVGKSLLAGKNFLMQADAAETDADNGG